MAESDAPFVEALFCDLLGLSHGRVIPSDRLGEDLHYCMTVMAQALDLRDDIVSGYGEDVGSPDMRAVVDPDSVRTGWSPRTSIALVDLLDHHDQPFALDPRQVLRGAVEAWRSLGYEPVVGFEMEFYALRDRPVDRAVPIEVPAHRVYGTGLGGDPLGTGREIFELARSAGLNVRSLTTEFSPGQLEVVLNHMPALRAADEAFLFRELARAACAEQGLWATFMGKPVTDLAGSGVHVNVSLENPDGSNAFEGAEEEHGLTDVARDFIAGLVARHRALCAIAAPTVNAYRRLVPGAIGYNGDWGLDHRLVAVRVPGDRGPATRIEYRVPDGAANPYLVTAAVLWAGLLGHEAHLELPAPRPLGSEPTGAEAPQDLRTALDDLEADIELVTRLGSEAMRAYIALRRHEWNSWRSAVTDWEVRTYASHY